MKLDMLRGWGKEDNAKKGNIMTKTASKISNHQFC